LKDVAEADRCAGWKEGKCPDGADAEIRTTCSGCNESFIASSDELMKEVMAAHFEGNPECEAKEAAKED
jgi:hypothetical protein